MQARANPVAISHGDDAAYGNGAVTAADLHSNWWSDQHRDTFWHGDSTAAISYCDAHVHAAGNFCAIPVSHRDCACPDTHAGADGHCDCAGIAHRDRHTFADAVRYPQRAARRLSHTRADAVWHA